MTTGVLRAGVLAGVDAWLAAPAAAPSPVPAAPPALAVTVGARLAQLGATVHPLAVDPLGEQPAVDAGGARGDGLPVVVWDGEGAFVAAAGLPGAPAGSGVAGVHAALDGAWLAVRAVATAVMHPGERGGKVIVLAPWPGDPHREAARAGLENLSRTLGIEWARLGVRSVTLLPGPATDADALAELTAYLASPAGDYFSGTALTLG